MKLAAMALLALVSTSVAVSAQTATVRQDDRTQTSPIKTSPIETSAFPVSPQSNTSGCPTSLHVQQISSVDMVQVENSQPKNTGQRLQLILANPDSKRIVGAAITVRGFTFKPGIMNAQATLATQDKKSRYATRTISVTFAPTTGKNVAATVVVPDMSAAQTIDLVSLNYADGSTWHLAADKACRITPDPLMLISAAAR